MAERAQIELQESGEAHYWICPACGRKHGVKIPEGSNEPIIDACPCGQWVETNKGE